MKPVCTCCYHFIFLIFCLFSKPLPAQDNHLRLWYEQPAAYFEECLMLGNGKMGASVFGGIQSDSIYLNDITLWSGKPLDSLIQPDAHRWIPAIRTALQEGRYALADSLQKKMQGSYSQSYAPLGTMFINFPSTDKVSDYQRELDLEHAISRISYRQGSAVFRREYFISHPDQVMVIKLTASELGKLQFDIKFNSQLVYQMTSNYDRLEINGRAPIHVEPSYRGQMDSAVIFREGEGTRFTTFIQITQHDGILIPTADGLGLRNASRAVILISAATSFKSFDLDPSISVPDQRQTAKEILDRALGQNYEKIRLNHEADYAHYFKRVTFSLAGNSMDHVPTDQRLLRYTNGENDPDLEALYFQFGRYLLISSSRTDGVPSNLQGLWNPYIRPPWSSNYTININLQENYWLAETANLSEFHQPLLTFIGNLAKTGAVTARTFFDANGWAACHNSDIWAMSHPVGDFGEGDPVWANWNMGGTWLSTHLWEHFLYNRDTAWLRSYAYPIMHGAAQFCLDWLVEDQQGYFITSPSTSPENKYRSPDGYLGATLAGATADLAIIRECFKQNVEASRLLGLDEGFRNGLVYALEKLRPYQIGRQGQLLEWYHDWEDADPQHRHQSHLFGLYPGHHISLDQTPELALAAVRSLELRGDESTGWSKGWRINLWARLRNADKAYQMYRSLLRYVEPDRKAKGPQGGGTYPNLWDAHPPFQIDGNFGGAAGVIEMLMQSSLNEIHLLPALPKEWKEGEIRGICARGGFVLDLIWKDGKLMTVDIFSRHGGATTLRYGDITKEIRIKKGGKIKIEFP